MKSKQAKQNPKLFDPPSLPLHHLLSSQRHWERLYQVVSLQMFTVWCDVGQAHGLWPPAHRHRWIPAETPWTSRCGPELCRPCSHGSAGSVPPCIPASHRWAGCCYDVFLSQSFPSLSSSQILPLCPCRSQSPLSRHLLKMPGLMLAVEAPK